MKGGERSIYEMYAEVPNTYGRYYASTKGIVYDIKFNKNVPIHRNKRGWLRIHIWMDGVRKTIGIHRIIALTFLGKSDLTVNHIDGDKENNCIDNLEYATSQYQNEHRSYILHRGNQKQIYCVETGDIYPSAKRASEVLNLSDYFHITKQARNKYGFKSVKGYHFKFVS